MKNFFKNFRSYSFWVSLCGALIILLNAFGRAFGFSIENQVVEDCILSFASVLVVLGIVTKDTKRESEKPQQDEKDSENVQNENEKSENDDVNK